MRIALSTRETQIGSQSQPYNHHCSVDSVSRLPASPSTNAINGGLEVHPVSIGGQEICTVSFVTLSEPAVGLGSLQAVDVILVNNGVCRDAGHFFAFTLCNDESVKGIPMMPGQRDRLTGVFFFNR